MLSTVPNIQNPAYDDDYRYYKGLSTMFSLNTENVLNSHSQCEHSLNFPPMLSHSKMFLSPSTYPSKSEREEGFKAKIG